MQIDAASALIPAGSANHALLPPTMLEKRDACCVLRAGRAGCRILACVVTVVEERVLVGEGKYLITDVRGRLNYWFEELALAGIAAAESCMEVNSCGFGKG